MLEDRDISQVLASKKLQEEVQGKRSLAFMLAGGDVDGDEFLVIKDQSLLPLIHAEPASYEGYMQSDVVGLMADWHLIIADQSLKYGMPDRDCMRLAALCSQAVDYPRNGVAVNMEDVPHATIHTKPDWMKLEDNDYRFHVRAKL